MEADAGVSGRYALVNGHCASMSGEVKFAVGNLEYVFATNYGYASSECGSFPTLLSLFQFFP